jgi:HNH endonuclease
MIRWLFKVGFVKHSGKWVCREERGILNEFFSDGITVRMPLFYKAQELQCTFDHADLETVRSAGGRWFAQWSKASQTFYVYMRLRKPNRLALHRLLTKAPRGMDVDHRDHSGLNNTRINLRVSTRSQNSLNRRVPSSLAYFRKDKTLRPWAARYSIEGVVVHVGSYATKELAHQASINARLADPRFSKSEKAAS